MNAQPTVRNGPVLLAPLSPEDAERVRLLAGDPAVADTALRIPHPYPDGAAEAWIAESIAGWTAGTCAVWKIQRVEDNLLVGAVGLAIDAANRNAELGYWIGTDFRGNGYATAGAQAAVRFGFDKIRLHRIHASCLRRNPASARVLEHAGLRYEGCLRDHVCHRGRFEDLLLYGVLRNSE